MLISNFCRYHQNLFFYIGGHANVLEFGIYNFESTYLQGVSHWNVSFELTLTDRNIQARFCFRVSVYFWGHGIWVSSTSFQKSNIGWPQQPPTETVPYISESLDFWWTIPQKIDQYWSFWCHWWSNRQDQEVFSENKALEAVEATEAFEFNNLRTKMF